MRKIPLASKPVSDLDEWYIRNGKMTGTVIDKKSPMHLKLITFAVIRMNFNEGWAESQMLRYRLLRRKEERFEKQHQNKKGAAQSNVNE